MKSRFSFRTPSALQLDATVIGQPVVARAGEVSLTHRFELKHNNSPRFARRRQERRQGQALLLAVLIMLLAALLSAGFLAVVSGNLNQTARIADKTKAIEASRAGIAYANAQLSGSAQGDLWRPINVSPAPVPGTPAYEFYYSQLDKVQGWANTLAPPTNTADPNYQRDFFRYVNATYGKFPDPNQSAGDAPKFLVRVEDLPVDPNDPYYNATFNPGHPYDAEHAGELKITSIGLSDDDLNVFHKSVAYKNGRRKSPWSQALRSVSNWDFKANNGEGGVPFSAVANAATVTGANAPVEISDTTAFSNDDVPFNVVIVKKTAPASVRGAVVTQVVSPTIAGNPAILTLARLDAPIGTDETIQKAAAIGTGSTIDSLNTGQTPTSNPTLANTGYFSVPLQSQPNGILANGSVWLQNQIQLSNLSANGTKLFASGSFAIDDATTGTGRKEILESGDVGPKDNGNPNSNLLVPSSQPTFPGDITLAAVAASNGVQTSDFIRDGWNKINTNFLGLDYSNSRDVEPFKPAKIDSAENLARYRALTRNADSDSIGYKLGVYIDNRDDIEKVGTTAMTQKQLVDMLLSPPSATAPLDYQRNGTAAAQGTDGSSLEQKHLRGWVGADEFLARGALVEISPDADLNGVRPSLRVTLDARGDSTPAELNRDAGPVADKAWRRADGTPDTGVYTRILPWPTNGTIFAEGNVRIRGDVGTNAAPRSLTVVSLGNIYVEGSLSVDNTPVSNGVDSRSKLMLLAKKNVIVNPTRAIMARLDTQTLTNGVASVTVGTLPALNTVSVPVANVTGFERGNYVVVDGTPNPIRGIVTAVNAIANTIEVETQDIGSVALNAVVRSPLEARETLGTTPNIAPYTTATSTSAINRRFATTPVASANYRLAMDHVGQRVNALRVETAGLPTGANTFDVFLSNKRPLDGGGLFQASLATTDTANKKIRADYSGPTTPGTDEFPQTYPTTQTDADGFSITALFTEMNAQTHLATPPTDPGWRYDVTAPATTIGPLPYYYLAGVGLRNAPGVAYSDTDAWRKPIRAAAYEIPLANSLQFDLNGVEQQRFGFNPDFLQPTDALTVDESFYQPDADVSRNSTLDSRALPAATAFQNIVLRQSPRLGPNPLPAPLPDERMRAMKLENIDFSGTNPVIRPAVDTMNINAFVYAQEGSWMIIPGDYFRSTAPVRTEVDTSGNPIGSYVDFNNDATVDSGEYALTDPADPASTKVADLNRNGIADPGEEEAALRFVRYNNFQMQFTGAIVENQTAVVADVEDTIASNPPIIEGAVQDWTNKWATYDSTATGATARDKFRFITYAYDPAILNSSTGANQLRIPVTDDLIYQQ